MEKKLFNSLFRCGFLTLFVLLIGIGNAKAIVTEFENYNGITISSEEYLALLNLGFSEDEIYYMDYDTYEANKDLDATLISKNTRYYKVVTNNMTGQSYTYEITEQEMLSQTSGTGNAPMSTVTTTYKTMVSTISSVSGGYRYKNSVSWTIIPSVKSYDIIGIGLNNVGGQYITSSVYSSYYYCVSSGACYNSTQYYDKKSTSTGGSAVYKIPDNPVVLSATLYFNVGKYSSAGTLYNVGMCADYAHATSSVSQSNVSDYTISFGGIGLGGSLNGSYDAIPCAISYVGTW